MKEGPVGDGSVMGWREVDEGCREFADAVAAEDEAGSDGGEECGWELEELTSESGDVILFKQHESIVLWNIYSGTIADAIPTARREKHPAKGEHVSSSYDRSIRESFGALETSYLPRSAALLGVDRQSYVLSTFLRR
nr:hypothetical protein CFP56_01331 [Quercus suber]